MSRLRGLSYPTIRNALDAVIAKLSKKETGREKKRHQILDAIARGELSVREGAKKLKEVEP